MSILDAPAHRAGTVACPSGASDGAARWVLRVLAWMVILAVLAILAVAVAVPRVAGATAYTVLTGSMRPGLPPGTLVVVRPTPVEEIGIGSVITYQLRSGEPEVVTHRVVAVRTTLDGDVELQTRGDANGTADPDWVRPEQVRGTLWYAVPHLGRAGLLLTGHERQLLVYGVAGALVLYAGAMFAGGARDRAARRTGRRAAR